MSKLLFGYFFLEQEGLEKEILVRGTAHFPIAKLISTQEEQNILDTVYGLIRDFFSAASISLDEVREIAFPDVFCIPLLQEVIDPYAETTKSLPYIFFKLGLQKKILLPARHFRWAGKPQVVDMWNKSDFVFDGPLPENVGPDPYKAVMDYRLVKQWGIVLECVNILLYRLDNETALPELLLIQRRNNQQWEFPQGGLHYHETPVEAALREVSDKLGFNSNQLAAMRNLNWQIDVPTQRGFYDARRIHGFSAQFTGRKTGIALDPRYMAYAWLPIADVRQRLRRTHAIDFLDRWENR